MLSSKELAGLWKSHSAPLLLIARGHCGAIANGAAEDCVQEAFVRLATQDPEPRDPAGWSFWDQATSPPLLGPDRPVWRPPDVVLEARQGSGGRLVLDRDRPTPTA